MPTMGSPSLVLSICPRSPAAVGNAGRRPIRTPGGSISTRRPATLVRFPDGTTIGARAFAAQREWDKPQFGVYLCSARTRRRIGRDSTVTWRSVWLEWPAFGLPRDDGATTEALLEAHRRARSGQIVEVACGSGRTRTGTAVAALAVAAGIAPDQAVAWARRHYRRRIMVLPWQRRWLTRNARRLRDHPDRDSGRKTP